MARSTEKLPAGELAFSTLTLTRGELVVAAGPDAGKRIEAGPGSTVRIGSAPDNDLVLSDGSVSARHALVQVRQDAVLVRDLGSTNGTCVDQVRITEAFLPPGARVMAGRSVLVFEPHAEELVVFPSASGRFELMTGKSRRMRELFGLLERVAGTDVSVLLLGETGAGKELAARSIHQASPRRERPFVVFDCGRASAEFLESELFGHEKGAFTGAAERRAGAFELADGGTLFIDEIGELSLELQPKLLRALERREVRPLGSSQPRRVDVRIVSATHRELSAMVATGTFREDLYYRLAVLEARIPPLRERREDVPDLVERLLEGRPVTSEALAVLANQPWRGNVRELANVLERAAAVAASGPIRPAHLLLLAAKPAPSGSLAGLTLRDIEKEAIRQTLEAEGQNRAAAAKSLGIASSTLFEKIKRYGLQQ